MIDLFFFNKHLQYLSVLALLVSPDIGISLYHLACASFQNEGNISPAIYLGQILDKLFNSLDPEGMVASGFVCSCSCKSQDRTGFRALFESFPQASLNKWVSLRNASVDDFLISVALFESC